MGRRPGLLAVGSTRMNEGVVCSITVGYDVIYCRAPELPDDDCVFRH